MRLLAVDFHYVHAEDKYPYPGIYAVSPERFRRQLQALGRAFEFVGQEELLGAIENRDILPEDSCIITFDDGFRSQYENALPILDEMGIPAIFFVCSQPLGEQRAVLVHKIHWLRANTAPEEFLEKLYRVHREVCGRELDMDAFDVEVSSGRRCFYPYAKDDEAKLKLILNKLLAPELRSKIINKLFQEAVSDEREFCGDFYMSREQIRDIHRRGWLGIHTHSHSPLSLLPQAAVRKEYVKTVETIGGVIGERATLYGVSYPYGNTEYINHEVAVAAKDTGLRYGFTMERAFNTTLKEPLLLARADANDVPEGLYPRMIIDENGTVTITGDFGERRSVFVEE